jgi:hypothetical protein
MRFVERLAGLTESLMTADGEQVRLQQTLELHYYTLAVILTADGEQARGILPHGTLTRPSTAGGEQARADVLRHSLRAVAGEFLPTDRGRQQAQLEQVSVSWEVVSVPWEGVSVSWEGVQGRLAESWRRCRRRPPPSPSPSPSPVSR